MGYLNTKDRVSQLGLNVMHSIFYNRCPEYIKPFFTKVRDIHSYNTRGSDFNFQVPKINTITATTFYYNAIKDWNALPVQVREIQSKDAFKRSVKKFLQDEAQQSEIYI